MKINRILSKVHCGQALLVSLAVAFFFTLALPLQTYLSNKGMFDYGFGELLREMLLLFIGVFIALVTILIVAESIRGRIVTLLTLLVGICGYLEVSILSIGMPLLNGELWLFARPSIRLYLDVIVVLTLFALGIWYRKRLYPWTSLISICYLIMSVAFVMDIGDERNHDKLGITAFDDGFCAAYDMVHSAAFSEERNVIVIIIDSAPADLAAEIMETDVSLKRHFPGFIEFKNNIGMHDCTTRGTPALVTGKYLEKETTLPQNELNFWGDDSAVKDYLNAGYNLYVRMGAGKSYTNRRTFSYSSPRQDENKWCVLKYTNDTPYITLLDVLKFRIVPYRRKLGVINNAIWRGEAHKGNGLNMVYREWQVYPILKNAEIIKDHGEKCFCIFHTEGVHVPIIKDENGEDFVGDANSLDAIKGALHYLIGLFADLMDNFRERGIYDNSMIIFTTDHGIVRDAKSALLWVKPFGDRSEFNSSNAPTSHSRIAELLKTSVTNDLQSQDVESILSQNERKLRIKLQSPEKWWQFGRLVDTYDIIYDTEGNEIMRKNLGEFLIN